MKILKEEIKTFLSTCTYSKNYKDIINRRLDDFLKYLVEATSDEDVHLEKIYETISIDGGSLFFSPLDTELVETYFTEHLYKSFNWHEETKRSLQSFFLYLNRKYDFPNLIEMMNFRVEDHKVKPTPKKKYVPTRHDLLKFLQVLLKNSFNLERDAIVFLLLITTGSRPSEILNTKVQDIDFVNETIYRKKTKNKSSKYIILREGFGKNIQKYIEKNNLTEDDYLINNNGSPLNLVQLQKIFEGYLNEAKLPFSTLHALRHSFATIMAESGAEILVIQQLLGHKKINSTNTYIASNYIRNYGMELQANRDIYIHIKNFEI
ncbi:tyrosine-type recombinase/integrase [Alkalihalophilus marmarensis]|uniref:tyrosine-type recombinase/integrase n=1 Tax=Alkalihalophilus marmarensis TaxID=521377 RepID=UPI002E20FFAF|nr:tyrosine-type recombinase/integrase [Alkalihalophilus marmarensis]MED1601199.1 tyrosine-type recombinase/integrase [Alkalihalophilus marmarensis]